MFTVMCVCWNRNRNRAVVNIGGTSGIADCCCVACSVKGNTRCIALSVNYKQFHTDTHTQAHEARKHARSAETNNPFPFIALPRLVPLFPSPPSGTLHPLLLWPTSSLFQFLHRVKISNGPGSFFVDVSGSHKEFSRRVISTSQRSLLENTQCSQQCHSRPRWDSNPQSQKVNGRRPTH